MNKGNFLMDDGRTICDNSQYEKYGCRLTILREGGLDDELGWRSPDKLIKRMNFPTCCDLSYLRGDFFTSKKGTKIFKIKLDGKHVLIRDSWGGAFNQYHGHTLPQGLYNHRASSNGGGCGNDYGVYPVDFRYSISEDDL